MLFRSIRLSSLPSGVSVYQDDTLLEADNGVYTLDGSEDEIEMISENELSESELSNIHFEVTKSTPEGDSLTTTTLGHEIETGDGDDTHTFTSEDNIDMEDGHDVLELSSDSGIDFDTIIEDQLVNLEAIDMSKTAGEHSIEHIEVRDILDITDDDNTLTILGDSEDTVTLEEGWTKTGTEVDVNNHNYDVYEGSVGDEDVILKIDDNINLDVI